MLENELTIINPVEFGIEESKASELTGNLTQITEERSALEDQYNEIIALDIEDKKTSQLARELRLKVKDNRTKGIEVWHKTTKDYFLKGGQFVDAIKRKEIAVNQRMEENLEAIEKHFEVKESERKKALSDERNEKLAPYTEFVPFGINFGEISEEEFLKVYNGSKLQYEAKIESDRKAEEERIASEKAEQERLAEEKRINDEKIEAQRIENERLKQEAEAREKAIKAEQEKRDKELAEERKKQEEELSKQRAESEAKIKAEREAREKAEQEKEIAESRRLLMQPYIVFIRDYNTMISLSENDFQKELRDIQKAAADQWEYERVAEKKQLEEEEKSRKEAEKLAKAPVKKQLTIWVDSFECPESSVHNEVSKMIYKKFEAFKIWAKSEIDKL